MEGCRWSNGIMRVEGFDSKQPHSSFYSSVLDNS
jgi:hypothetical protein